ncbi:MAG: zinc-ribbon domain-containing protein, partial [Mycobacterium leprae]
MAPHHVCPFCGTSVSPEARYCNHCGTPLTQLPAPPRPDRGPARVAVWACVLVLLLVVGTGPAGGVWFKSRRLALVAA